ncbi:Dephospho-CoA kinase [Candidatus Cyrtobacter comes]|uniref:Dephospho-CoA kinase n=1 Tax=Candidatus Cyrtobacter comes TaxID=675776 RepID=A0ABU5L8T9_9RICK|nr:dephospho-CoA kinase [Candidatus Cyrtobacter comes]MDZ5762537.1 Dephospho-CoA kinase [Candidatus Cyrtobacter comes]
MERVFIVTGAIASGKTFLLSKMRKFGFLTLNVDKIAKSILANNIIIQKKIIEQFPIYKDSLGGFDIYKFIINASSAALCFVEELIHPIVRAECNNLVRNVRKQSKRPIALEIPLFIESLTKGKICYLYEKVIVTHSRFDIREKRAMLREHMTKEKFDAITSRQTTDDMRFMYADYIVCCENDYSINSFLRELIERNSFRY